MSESTNSVSKPSSADNSQSVWSRNWPWIRKVLTVLFFAAVAWLLVSQARSIEWGEVWAGLQSYSGVTIGFALLITTAAYLCYTSYDLFGRHYIKTSVSRVETMMVAFIAFSFNLNLGALVGSLGVRYRLYTQLGLGKAEVAHVVGMTVSTNWLGYLLLAGLAFASGTVEVPVDWAISNLALRLLGAAFVLLVAVYLLLCRFSRRRIWVVRGHELHLPRLRIALLQLLIACSHWLLMAGVVYSFLHGKVEFMELLGVLLVSSIAGAVAHIPGGLGVIEAVFVLFLSGDISRAQILAALIAYRGVFYLCPLIVATALYVYMETVVTRRRPA